MGRDLGSGALLELVYADGHDLLYPQQLVLGRQAFVSKISWLGRWKNQI